MLYLHTMARHRHWGQSYNWFTRWQQSMISTISLFIIKTDIMTKSITRWVTEDCLVWHTAGSVSSQTIFFTTHPSQPANPGPFEQRLLNKHMSSLHKRRNYSQTYNIKAVVMNTRKYSRQAFFISSQIHYLIKWSTKIPAKQWKKLQLLVSIVDTQFLVHNMTEYLIYVAAITLCLRKKQDTKLLPITSPNVNRFSKFFHCLTHW